ncbi:MAG: (2Fe-2S) ferredoxin domain-containing protein [Acidobacteria bacterium]|uniref:(2Fe-2S) ferredoxin domain-containing protein n=1 Tax=Candidatus Polarisedimenticola svalbardensis TaxID=2886004 RepID=A0A8J7CLG9_9BACT|nr:(2Fe-2S) ferredoxin domain-containing protein [Candidatus Polarisedimenticola svalbardensis]
MQVFKRHVFVCINQRAARHRRGDCHGKAGTDVHQALKTAVAQAGLSVEIRINKAGCLDQCSQGPVIVVYPEAVWYVQVGLEDVDEIVKRHLIGGEVVERLVMTRTDREL